MGVLQASAERRKGENSTFSFPALKLTGGGV